MLRIHKIAIDSIYVPTARRKTLDPETVRKLAEDILENGMKVPVQLRHDGNRHVLVEGLHRLEAAKSLGETAIAAYLVQARKH
jgi:ParB-like chromosome segregation protein Spo0J